MVFGAARLVTESQVFQWFTLSATQAKFGTLVLQIFNDISSYNRIAVLSVHTCEFLNSENKVNSTCRAWILLLCTGMSRIPVTKKPEKKQVIINNYKHINILWTTQCNSVITVTRNVQISIIAKVVATYHRSNPHIDSTPHPDLLLEAQPLKDWKNVLKICKLLSQKLYMHTPR